MDRKINKITDHLGRDIPLTVKIFLNYIVNPVSVSASVVGILTVIIYTIGKFMTGPLGNISPLLADILKATQIPALCSMLNPQAVYIAGFGSLFIGGFIKMLDERIKKRFLDGKNRDN